VSTTKGGAHPLGRKLRRMRRLRGLTVRKAAELCGANEDSWTNWERGLFLPRCEALVTIADVFGVTLDEMMRPERPVVRRADFGPPPRTALGALLLAHALAGVHAHEEPRMVA
jgi:transcriptional regulator with XRE-family HTH domain